MYQNPFTAQYKRDGKVLDVYEVTELHDKEDDKWKELELQLILATVTFKRKLAGTIEAMTQESKQNMWQAKAGSRKQPERLREEKSRN